jgi:hypothetical protein
LVILAMKDVRGTCVDIDLVVSRRANDRPVAIYRDGFAESVVRDGRSRGVNPADFCNRTRLTADLAAGHGEHNAGAGDSRASELCEFGGAGKPHLVTPKVAAGAKRL